MRALMENRIVVLIPGKSGDQYSGLIHWNILYSDAPVVYIVRRILFQLPKAQSQHQMFCTMIVARAEFRVKVTSINY